MLGPRDGGACGYWFLSGSSTGSAKVLVRVLARHFARILYGITEDSNKPLNSAITMYLKLLRGSLKRIPS